MKYSLSSLLKISNSSQAKVAHSQKKIIKAFYFSLNQIWKFLFIYEFFSIWINLIIVSSEYYQNYYSKITEPIYFIKLSFRILQIGSLSLAYWLLENKYKKLSFDRSEFKIFLFLSGGLDILIFCHLDVSLLANEDNHIYGSFLIVKSLFFSFFLDKLISMILTSTVSLFYIIIWTFLKSKFISFDIPKLLIYSTLILILMIGCYVLLRKSTKSKNPMQTKQTTEISFKAINENPFFEIIPEGIILVKADNHNFKIIYHNQFLFKTLEIDKFYPTYVEDISQYLSNFIRSINKNVCRTKPLHRSLKNNINASFQTYVDLKEILLSLETDLFKKEEEITQYFVANRVDPSNPGQDYFQIELTVKRINHKKEPFFIIMMQSMKEKKMFQDLLEKDDFKSRLLSSFSHELKTPLNGTIPCLELLLDEERIDDNLKDNFIRTSLSCLKLLLSTINDIIDYSLISSEQMLLNIRPIDMIHMISEVEGLVKSQMDSKQITFLTNIKNLNFNPLFYSDYNRITQILLNILINAIKFTNSGGSIHFQIKLETINLVDHIFFEIRDTGIGMCEEQLNEVNLFLKKITDNIDLNFGLNINSTGCGFGLLISQYLILLLGPDDPDICSKLKVNSIVNVGTTVSFAITDKKPRFIESHSSLNAIKSNKTKNSCIMDSLKIEFRRQLNYSMKKTIKTENSIISPLSNDCNEFESIHLEIGDINIEKIMRKHNFNDGLKFLINELNEEEKSHLSLNLNPFDILNLTFRQSMNQIDSINELNSSNLKKVCECEELLIVDDDTFNLLSLEMLLRPWNLKIKKAMNGQEAVNIVKNHYEKQMKCCRGFKAIIMDYQMPIKDGVEATKELISLMHSRKIPSIPIIGCTAFVTRTEINKCYESGMKDVMFKPLNKLIISDIVNNWIL